jgi:ATP-binding cassette, subfamily B, multidrug efflux pump
MLRWLESRIDPFRRLAIERPPGLLWAFYWHFVRPVWPPFLLVLVLDLLAALTEVALAKFVADLIDLLKGGSPTRRRSLPTMRVSCCGWRSWC